MPIPLKNTPPRLKQKANYQKTASSVCFSGSSNKRDCLLSGYCCCRYQRRDSAEKKSARAIVRAVIISKGDWHDDHRDAVIMLFAYRLLGKERWLPMEPVSIDEFGVK